MNIPAPTKPAESIPTEGDALAVYLVGFYRYEMVTARRAVEEYEAPDELPAEK
jgi:hypothetical protein